MYNDLMAKAKKVIKDQDLEKQSKKRAYELEETLEAIGQENETKAAKEVIRFAKEQEKEEQKRREKELEVITSAKGFVDIYYQRLAEACYRRLKEVSWPEGIGYHIHYDERGIAIAIHTRDGRRFAHGFKPSGDAIIDLWECDRFGDLAENTVDVLGEKKFYPTDSL